MTDQTREEYAVFWGGKEPLAVCSSRRGAEWAVIERRFHATFQPESMRYEPLPEGEPHYRRRTIEMVYGEWEDATGREYAVRDKIGLIAGPFDEREDAEAVLAKPPSWLNPMRVVFRDGDDGEWKDIRG